MAEELVKGNLQNWTSKKEVAASFGVCVRTITNIAEKINKETAFPVEIHTRRNMNDGDRNVVYYDNELINKIGLQLKKNAISQGKQSEVVKQSNIDKNDWIPAKEIYESVCSRQTWENFKKDVAVKELLQRETELRGSSHTMYCSQEVAKAFQLWLKKNAANAGGQKTGKSLVKQDNIGDMAIGFVFTKGSVAQQKDMLAFLQEKVAQQEALELSDSKVKQLEHALEYDKVAGWKPWNHLKKEIQYKGNFQKLVDAIPLIKDEDYSKKVMADDCYPTTLISLTGEEKIIDYKETVLDEK